MKTFKKLSIIILILMAGYVIYRILPTSQLSIPLLPAQGGHPESIGRFNYTGEVRTTGGEKKSLSDFSDKVIFLSFWATWCPPCKAEMPNIQNLYNTLRDDKDIEFLLISAEDGGTAQRFMDASGYTMPVYIADHALPTSYGVRGIPTTFIIDRKGDMVLRHTGTAKWDDVSFVDFLLGLK